MRQDTVESPIMLQPVVRRRAYGDAMRLRTFEGLLDAQKDGGVGVEKQE